MTPEQEREKRRIAQAAEDALTRRIERREARTLLAGIIPQGFDPAELTPTGRKEVRDAIDCVLKLTHGQSPGDRNIR